MDQKHATTQAWWKFDFRSHFKALQFLPRFLQDIRKTNPGLFYSNLMCRLLVSLSPVAALWVGKLIIDSLIHLANHTGSEVELLWKYVVLEFLIIFVTDILNRIINVTEGLLGDQYSIQSSVLLITKTSNVEISQLEDAEFYDKLERARQQTTARVVLLSNTLGQIQDFVSLISLVAGLLYFEPWLIVLIILSIIPGFINEIRFSNSSYSLSKSWTPERRELDYLRYIGANDKTAKELKLFGLAQFIAERFRLLSLKYYQANKNLSLRRTRWGVFYNLLGTLSYYGAYILIITKVLKGVISIGDLTFLSGSFSRLKSRLEATFSRFTRISESALHLRDYYEFIDLQPDQQKAFTPIPIPSEIREGFVFENVHFAYPQSDKEVLRGISFLLRVGEKMALVGENGAGKTTLIKLILRFYEPTAGRILLDGVDIRHFDKQEYQKIFGVIFQDFVRYEFTLRENIAVGKIEAISNENQILEAAERSLALDVIDELSEGLNQQLGKRFTKGVELSGGQWQKIALARAYMKDAGVMILDEPTSALDARAEYEAFQRFIGLTEGKTSLIISHRFSTVRMADRIIVLDEGKILEMGTHEELLKQNKLYAELFHLQAAGYR